MMLKKTIFILTLFSGNVIAATVELGFENEQYNYAYRSADVFMPYIKSNFNPVTDSALNVSLTYMYQDQYGKKHKKTSEDRFKTNRDRIELYLKGYTLNRGAYSFSPSADEFSFSASSAISFSITSRHSPYAVSGLPYGFGISVVSSVNSFRV